MMKTADASRDAILRDLRTRLKGMADEQFSDVDPTVISARMARMVPPNPGPGEYGKLIGPVYSTGALEALWGVTRAAVSKKAKEGRLLVLKVERENLFPVFQLEGDRVRTDVMEVVGLLREAVDPFTIAQWLKTPQVDDPEGRTPLDLLDAGQNESVLAAASKAAARWAA